MTLPRLEYSTRIADRLNELAGIAKSRSRASLTDANHIIETVVARLLNTLFGWQLVNLNADEPNHPAADLGDRQRRVSVQVTVQEDSKKIKDTAAKALAHGLSKEFDRVVLFFLLPRKPNLPRGFVQPSGGPEVETWDIADLLKQLTEFSDPGVLREASRVLDEELGRISPVKSAGLVRFGWGVLVLFLVGVLWTWAGRGFPVVVTYVNQYETNAGYVLHLRIRSNSGDTVYVPRESFRVRITHDDALLQQMAPGERTQLAYGESATIFTSKAVLDAAIAGRSYANTGGKVACGPEPTDLFLLITIQGPGSTNPSARLQLGAVYLGLVVSLKTVLGTRDYVDVPVQHVPLISGDKKTRVIQR